MQLFMVGWATLGEFEAEKDDSSLDCVADLATPRAAMILETLTDEDLRKIFEAVEADLNEVREDEDEDGEELPLEPEKKGYRFEAGEWDNPRFGSPSLTIEVYDKAADDYVATIVIRKVETGH